MFRTRSAAVFVTPLIALATLAGGAGCKKKDPPKAAPAAGSGATAGTAGKAGALTPIAPASGTIDPVVARTLAALPADADTVFGLDYSKVFALPAVQGQATKLGSRMLPFDIKAECGIDPLTSLRSAIIGVNAADTAMGSITGIGKAAMLPCLDKIKAKLEASGGTLTIDGVYAWGTVDGRNFGMAYIDDSTALFAGSQTAPIDKALLEGMAASTAGGGLTGNAEFMRKLAQVNTSATGWALASGARLAMLPDMVTSMLGGKDFQAVLAAVDYSAAGLAVDLRLVTGSDASAKEMVDGMGTQMGALRGGMATKADLTAEGPDVHAVVLMTPAQIDRLGKMVKAFLGPMLGQVMGGGRGAPALPPPAAIGSGSPGAPAPAPKGP